MDFTIIGPGKLGSTLIAELKRKKMLSIVVGGKPPEAEKPKNGFRWYKSLSELSSLSAIVMITVGDSDIQTVVDDLINNIGNNLDGICVVHTSGAVPLAVLDPLRKFNCMTAVLHPYQTFYRPDIKSLDNINWTIETESDPSYFFDIVRVLKGNPVLLGDNFDKPLYHVSAVSVSNFVNTSLSLAGDLADLNGLNKKEFFIPIINRTVHNYFEEAGAGSSALTGPFARADLKTINLHISALKKEKELLSVYCLMGLATAKMARKNKLIRDEEYNSIIETIKEFLDI